MVAGSNDETKIPRKSSLTNIKISRIHKAFANRSSADTKFSKTHLSNVVQLGGFLGKFLGPLLKASLSSIRSVLKPLTKRVLIPSRLITVAPATDAAIQKKIFESGMTTLIISNEEMDNIVHINKSLEESFLLIKSFSKTNQNETKEQTSRFCSMLLGILGASSLGNLLTDKGIKRSKISGQQVMRAGKGTIRARHDF